VNTRKALQKSGNDLVVTWCNICNARPADGVLTVWDEDAQQTLDLDACEPCVVEIPAEDWVQKGIDMIDGI
jgi:hypothetical protein